MSHVKPRLVALIALGLALGSGAEASTPAQSHGAKPAHGEVAEKPKAEDPNKVMLPTLIAPVLEGARLTGYLYLTIKLTAASSRDADHLREVLPLVQDTLLRALHDHPLQAAEVDGPGAKDALIRTVMTALGRRSDIHGVEAAQLADYQSVPF